VSAPTTRYAQVNGEPCRVWEKGAGSTIGFLAGIGGLTAWPPFLDCLAADHRVVAPSLPGFPGGGTLHAEMDGHLDWLLATHDLLDGSDLSGCHLMGVSIGGSLAAEAAASWPGIAKTLTLVSPFGLFDVADPVADIFAQRPGRIRNLMCNNPDNYDSVTSGVADEDELENEVIRTRAHESAARFLWPLGDTGLNKRLPRITQRTHLVWGDSDQVVPLNYARKFEAGIAGDVSTSVIADAGHLAELDQPQAVADAVLKFIGRGN